MYPDTAPLCALLREVAATEILPRFRHSQARRKDDGSLITAADLAAQTAIAAALARDRPDWPLLGEEMPPAEQRRLLASAEPGVWVLDPLDGTGNFAGGFPFFSLSLALIQGGRTVLGIVLDPVRDECFAATLGGGATLNGAAIAAFAPGAGLGDCLALVDLKRLSDAQVVHTLGPGGFRSQRNLGSVALDWCWLAAGRAQLYLHGGQRLWDYAAGRLIATEAGAVSRLHVPPARGDSGLGRPAGPEPALEPRLAIAAANVELLERWSAFVGI